MTGRAMIPRARAFAFALLFSATTVFAQLYAQVPRRFELTDSTLAHDSITAAIGARGSSELQIGRASCRERVLVQV